MMMQDTLTLKARTIFRQIRSNSTEYLGKTVSSINFLIPLHLSEFIRQEEQCHLLLVSWRYSTFLEPILSGANPPELGKKGGNSICRTGGVVVVRDNSLSIFERSVHLAREKLCCPGMLLVFAIVPASEVLLKRLQALTQGLPQNLVLIVQGNIPYCNTNGLNYPGWHLSIANGEGSAFLTDVIRIFKKGEAQKPQLVIVVTAWEQIII